MEFPIYTIDTFSDGMFTGNPTAVVLLKYDQNLNDNILLKIVYEINQSVTAFVKLLNQHDAFSTANEFELRFFSPIAEVPMCGHATMAAAAVLFSICSNNNDRLDFRTKKNQAFAKKYDGNKLMVELPLESRVETLNLSELCQEWRVIADQVAGNLPIHEISFYEKMKFAIIRLKDTISLQELKSIQPDFDILRKTGIVERISVTVKGNNTDRDTKGNSYDFMSRVFVPWIGSNENSASGIAYQALSSFWCKLLEKDYLYAVQGSYERHSSIELKVKSHTNTVELIGENNIMIRGKINLSEEELQHQF